LEEEAGIYIVNTCTVTHTGEQKSLQALRRIRAAHPNALLAACGCLVQTNTEAIKKAGADIIFDARKPDELIAQVTLPPVTEALPLAYTSRTRAYIKIQDGCDRFCSYCIVPHVRGPLTSRPLIEILDEARELIAQGVKEIVLTGIQAAAYGYDKTKYHQVIEGVASLPGLARLRLGSIEPYAVDADFLNAVSHPVICPHFHLSLQSGCDATLRCMNRRYTTAEYAALAKKIRECQPGAALTTDIMVGFPGETDDEFEESLRFTEEMQFARMHVFVYSPRKGTPAAEYPGQVTAGVKAARGKRMRDLAKALEHKYLADKIGRSVPVLFEAQNGTGCWEGHTPDYIAVRVRHDGDLGNAIINVRLEEPGIPYGGKII
jgi:threonylcarbamoyladenosine tRNA methylthiotransferase MtaB